jgi:hypothetical protein
MKAGYIGGAVFCTLTRKEREVKITILGPAPQRHIVICVFEGKPYGIPDNERIDVIPLEGKNALSSGQNVAVSNRVGMWQCWVPSLGCWVGYHLCSYQERSTGPNEENAIGPYLFYDAPPTEDERHAAAVAQTLVIRTDWQF